MICAVERDHIRLATTVEFAPRKQIGPAAHGVLPVMRFPIAAVVVVALVPNSTAAYLGLNEVRVVVAAPEICLQVRGVPAADVPALQASAAAAAVVISHREGDIPATVLGVRVITPRSAS